MSASRVFTNVVLFQAAWFATVHGASNGREWWAYAATAGVVVVHLAWVRRRILEPLFLALVAAAGFAADSALIFYEVFEAPGDSLRSPLGPTWLLCLWLNFATLLHASLSWLLPRSRLAALFGAVGGPLTYWGGSRFGAIEFGGDPVIALGILAVLWAMLMPLFGWLGRHAVWGEAGRK